MLIDILWAETHNAWNWVCDDHSFEGFLTLPQDTPVVQILLAASDAYYVVSGDDSEVIMNFLGYPEGEGEE